MQSNLNSEDKDRAVSNEMLKRRLELNNKYQLRDFNEWLFRHFDIGPGQKVLDVGCGNGAQTFWFANLVGSSGFVTGIDMSAESIAEVNRELRENVSAIVGDMSELDFVLDRNGLSEQYFDLVHCSYAIPYSTDTERTLNAMFHAMTKEGRMVVFVPYHPHGLVEFVKRYAAVPDQVTKVFDFGPRVLEPFFRRRFWDVSIHLFQNQVSLPGVDDVMSFYEATTYYDDAAAPAVKQAIEAEINATGAFTYEKNGYLIEGSWKRKE